MKGSGTLRQDLLAAIRSRPDARIAALIDDDHVYSGRILFSADDRAVQEVGGGVLVVHDSSGWEFEPDVGETYIVSYRDGTGFVSSKR